MEVSRWIDDEDGQYRRKVQALLARPDISKKRRELLTDLLEKVIDFGSYSEGQLALVEKMAKGYEQMSNAPQGPDFSTYVRPDPEYARQSFRLIHRIWQTKRATADELDDILGDVFRMDMEHSGCGWDAAFHELRERWKGRLSA